MDPAHGPEGAVYQQTIGCRSPEFLRFIIERAFGDEARIQILHIIFTCLRHKSTPQRAQCFMQ